jgi:hypothetical protein
VLTGIGLGRVIAPSINVGTFGVAPRDADVASATVTVGQPVGIFAAGAIICGLLLRRGPLHRQAAPADQATMIGPSVIKS